MRYCAGDLIYRAVLPQGFMAPSTLWLCSEQLSKMVALILRSESKKSQCRNSKQRATEGTVGGMGSWKG